GVAADDLDTAVGGDPRGQTAGRGGGRGGGGPGGVGGAVPLHVGEVGAVGTPERIDAPVGSGDRGEGAAGPVHRRHRAPAPADGVEDLDAGERVAVVGPAEAAEHVDAAVAGGDRGRSPAGDGEVRHRCPRLAGGVRLDAVEGAVGHTADGEDAPVRGGGGGQPPA